MTRSTFVDSNGINWHDARLREPEHWVGEHDGFELEIERLVQGEHVENETQELWKWSVMKKVATDDRSALDRRTGIDRSRARELEE